MVFSSLHFLFLFLPLTLALCFLLPGEGKNVVLLLASVFFYAWGEPVYVVLMLFSVSFNYVCGLELAQIGDAAGRKRALVFNVAVNLLLLGFFKYAGFAVETVNSLLSLNLSYAKLPLPIGISFYTFQALSYVIDVYRGDVPAQKSFLRFAVYITMFPQLVAGPIVKYSDIERQLAKRRMTPVLCGLGAERLVRGLAKKVLLANNLGLLYTTIQADPERSVLTAWLGMAAYTMQIYFDFSGYSDMAIGMGQMLGFRFLENFNFPYVARSVTDFWRRWHMSLSGWFRDYVYIPLGGNRVSVPKHIRNLLIVWMLTGLWHGASWNFVLWGLYYGVLLILEKYLFGPVLEKLPGVICHVLTMVLVGIGWVIFSNTSFPEMSAYLGNLFGAGAAGLADGMFLYYLRNHLILLLISGVCCVPAVRDLLHRHIGRAPVSALCLYLVLFLVSVASLVYGSYNPFLYFRF